MVTVITFVLNFYLPLLAAARQFAKFDTLEVKGNLTEWQNWRK